MHSSVRPEAMGIREFLFFWTKGTYVKVLYAKLKENRMGEDGLKIGIFRGLKKCVLGSAGPKNGPGPTFFIFF